MSYCGRLIAFAFAIAKLTFRVSHSRNSATPTTSLRKDSRQVVNPPKSESFGVWSLWRNPITRHLRARSPPAEGLNWPLRPPGATRTSPSSVNKAPDAPDWLHEITLDGYRMHARLDAGRVQILTR